MTKRFLPLLVLLVLFGGLSVSALRADVITLANGETMEGRVVKETDSEVTIEVKISDTITDERVIQRAEIKSIEKPAEDEVAFQQIKDIRLNPDSSVALEMYDQAISKLKTFAETYPLSPHVAAVRETLAAFESERDRVAKGEIKLLGRWISREEAEQRQYQIQAQMLYANMRAAAARGDLSGAMNTFETLQASYPRARVFPDAVELARQVLRTLSESVVRHLQRIDYDKKQRDQMLAATQEPRRSELLRTIQAQEARYEAVLAASKAKWVPFIPGSEKSMKRLQEDARREAARLDNLPVAAMRTSLEATEAARKALEAGQTAAADDLLKKAQAAWSQNEEIEYFRKLVAARKETERKVAQAKPTSVQATTVTTTAAAKPAGAAGTERPFFMTLPGALTILVAVLVIIGGGTLLGKMRGRQKE